MAVLHITYKHDPQISKADYDGFYKVITSYQWRRLSDSNWTIDAEDPPQAIWQKFKRYIDPNDYFLMLPLDPNSFSPKDRTVLSWLAARPQLECGDVIHYKGFQIEGSSISMYMEGCELVRIYRDSRSGSIIEGARIEGRYLTRKSKAKHAGLELAKEWVE